MLKITHRINVIQIGAVTHLICFIRPKINFVFELFHHTGDALSTSDIFGISNPTIFSAQLESTPPGFPYSPITPNSLNSSSPADSNSSSRNYDGFQVGQRTIKETYFLVILWFIKWFWENDCFPHSSFFFVILKRRKFMGTHKSIGAHSVYIYQSPTAYVLNSFFGKNEHWTNHYKTKL